MEQVAAAGVPELLLNDDVKASDIEQARRRVSSSEQGWKEFKELRSNVAGQGGAELAKAACAWIEGRYDEAIEATGKLTSNSVAQYIEGRCLLAKGDASAAAAAFEKAVGELGEAGGHAFLARAARLAGDLAAAASAVKDGLKEFAGDPQLLTEEGILRDLEGDWEAAAEKYRAALEADEWCVEALFRLAYVSDLRGDAEGALELYHRCVAVKPVHVNALVNLGLLYEELDRPFDAIRCFRHAVAHDPTCRRARLYLADAEAGSDMYFDEELQKRRERRNKILETPITDFELSVRSRNCLEKMNVHTLGDLTRISEQELLSFKNFGETSLTEIRRMMAIKGLRLGQALEEEERGPEAGVRPAVRKDDAVTRLLAKPVEELGLSVRSQHCMSSLGVKTIGDLVHKTEKGLLATKNFGATSLAEVKKKLGALALSLAGKE
ncbi:MAG: DNA-directed RNA polymerase subunit alpha C-terminal domain-containing protein [Planctomycetota bacterium]|jgi:DNA-directed RNA polymerase subunit alpha